MPPSEECNSAVLVSSLLVTSSLAGHGRPSGQEAISTQQLASIDRFAVVLVAPVPVPPIKGSFSFDNPDRNGARGYRHENIRRT
jgi:hypothetical protein